MTDEQQLEAVATEEELEAEHEEQSEPTAEGNADDEGKAEEDQPKEPAEADPKDVEIENLRKQNREMDGRLGAERGTKNLMHRMVRKLEVDGKLDRDEIAQELGLDRKRVDGILDATPTDDGAAFVKRAEWADTQLRNVAGVLKSSGKDADAISNVYAQLLQHDAAERERFMELPEGELMEHIISRAAEAEADVGMLVESKGDALAALKASRKRIIELEGEISALKGSSDKPKGQPKPRVPLVSGGGAGREQSQGASFMSKVLG